MQNDEVIWKVIGENHCSFRSKTETQSFCRNQYNVSGLCDRKSCPLANSSYATVIEREGTCFLYVKVPERAHTPKNLWEKIKLVQNYERALKQIDEHLEYWPEYLVHKNKQRFTKIIQFLMRKRKLAKTPMPRLVPVKQKTERRERAREEKAERAANLEVAIEKELLDRLKTGAYEGIYNYPPKLYNKALDRAEMSEAEEVEYVEEEISESEEEIDIEDVVSRKRARYEYEQELEDLNSLTG